MVEQVMSETLTLETVDQVAAVATRKAPSELVLLAKETTVAQVPTTPVTVAVVAVAAVPLELAQPDKHLLEAELVAQLGQEQLTQFRDLLLPTQQAEQAVQEQAHLLAQPAQQIAELAVVEQAEHPPEASPVVLADQASSLSNTQTPLIFQASTQG